LKCTESRPSFGISTSSWSNLSYDPLPMLNSNASANSEQLPALSRQPSPMPEPLSPHYEEKRQFPRIPFRGKAKAVVFPVADNPSKTIEDSEVVTSDLSRGGVSILHRTQLVRGQQLMLMLNDSMQLVEVCWCCRVWDGFFAAGCRFLNQTRPYDLEQQLAAIDVVISSEESWWEEDESSK